MTVGETIKHARKLKGMSQEELGRRCGTIKQTIYKYETGVVTNIPLERLTKICEILEIDAANIITGRAGEHSSNRITLENISSLPHLNQIPLLCEIACGEPMLAEENVEDMVDIPEHISADFALRCRDDSMVNARIFDGDIVYICQQPTVNDGEIAAVLIGEKATLKRVRFYEGRVALAPENPRYRTQVYSGEELDSIRILGKAVAFTSIIQ